MFGPIGSSVLTFNGYKQTDRQAKFIYTYSDNQETEAKEENTKAFDIVTKQVIKSLIK